MNGIKLYRIASNVAEYYRLNVKDNKDTPYELIVRKLTRDVLLAKKLDLKNYKDREVYLYGELVIIVNPKTNTIMEISNYTYGNLPYWRKDIKKYNMLNEALGIKPDIDKYKSVV